jgi:hypothetical protein
MTLAKIDHSLLAEHAAAIRTLGKRVITDVIEIGRRLTEARKLLPEHGNRYSELTWSGWLKREFNWEERTALRFTQVFALAESRDDNLSALELPVSGLYLLAAPSTSEAARTEVIARAESGERLQHAEVRAIIAQHDKPKTHDDETKPNGARALMASRQEPADSLDFFPTPPFATRALIERVLPVLGIRQSDLANMTAWEPACGEGHMAEPLAEYFSRVIATDKHDYGYGEAPVDFLCEDTSRDADWCITNPPFEDKAIRFVLRALKLARVGTAMFVRLQWLETIGRYELVFRDHPPTLVSFFVERVNLCKGRWEPDGGTATAYCWLIWIRGEAPRPPFWIPPGCREQLTRADDAIRFTTHPIKSAAPLGDGLGIPAFLHREAVSAP